MWITISGDNHAGADASTMRIHLSRSKAEEWARENPRRWPRDYTELYHQQPNGSLEFITKI